MIKPPSLIHEFSLIWSGDSSLVFPSADLPATATPEERKKADADERDRLFKIAAETGNWSALATSGQPTLFNFRDPSREEISWWRAQCGSGHEGAPLSDVGMNDLLVRIAIRSVENFGKHKVVRRKVAKNVEVADVDIIEALYESAPSALVEFAEAIYARMTNHIRPLS